MKKGKQSDFDVYSKAVSMGAVAGLRAMLAPALLSYAASPNGKSAADNFFASRGAAATLGLLAVGELIGDKLPGTPNRTELSGLAARVVSGAIVGGVICARRKKSAAAGIALGALAAVAAAYTGQNIRRAIAEKTGVHSSVVGAAEDVLAIGIGAAALKDYR